MQQVQGFAPAKAGLALLPTIVIITFLSGYGGSLADRLGPRMPMIAGPLVVAAGMALLVVPGVNANYFLTFLPGLALFGLGMSAVIAPLTKSALSVPHEYSGAASGVNNAFARIAALLAIAVLGALAIPIFSAALRSNVGVAPLTPQEREVILSQSGKFRTIEIPATFSAEAASAASAAVKKSFVRSFRIIMAINALLAMMSAFIAMKYIRNKKPVEASSDVT
jgi:MFS family permease